MTQVKVELNNKEEKKISVCVGDCFITKGGRIIMVCSVGLCDYRLVLVGKVGENKQGNSWDGTKYNSLEDIEKEIFDSGDFAQYVSSMEMKINETEWI